MPMNEEETKYELINPVLREKGYRMPYIKIETPAPVEPTGPKGRRRSGPGRTDYLLCVEVPNGTVPLPVAILEAKKEDEDLLIPAVQIELKTFGINPRRAIAQTVENKNHPGNGYTRTQLASAERTIECSWLHP